jgi:hypothetical protein
VLKLKHPVDDGGGGNPTPNIVTDTMPQTLDRGFRDIDGYDDVAIESGDVIPEGVPPDLASKSREELLAEIAARQRAAAQDASKVDPIGALTSQFGQFLQQSRPAEAPVEGWKAQSVPSAVPTDPMALAEYRKKLNDKFLDDPVGAQQEVLNATLTPFLQQLAQNQALQSRELAMIHPETKDIFSRYGREVEQEVSMMPVQEKLQNPRVYQVAIERVKARHLSDLVAEQAKTQVDTLLAARLQELGLDPAILQGQKPAAAPTGQPTLANPVGNRPVTPQSKTTIRLTPAQRVAVEREALAKGVSIEAVASRWRDLGKI